MIQLFRRLYQKDKQYRLLMVGDGELRREAEKAIHAVKLEKAAVIYPKIPNNKMWELYRIAEYYINLNQQEIFGMAILEAMYYETAVAAFEAPGPSYIIEKQPNGLFSAQLGGIACTDFEACQSQNRRKRASVYDWELYMG